MGKGAESFNRVVPLSVPESRISTPEEETHWRKETKIVKFYPFLIKSVTRLINYYRYHYKK